jgi:hypothetical protein
MKLTLRLCLLFTLLTFVAGNTYASGIPVIDVASLVEAVADTINQGSQLEEAISTYRKLNQQYSLLKSAHDEWSDNVNIDFLLNNMNNNELLVILESAGLLHPPTKSMEVASVTSASIWGSQITPAREVYEKRSSFIHDNITKVNKLHDGVVARQANIKALASQISDKTTDKHIATITAGLLVEQAMMQNEQMIISLLAIELQLGVDALNLEDQGSIHIKRSGVEDVH